MRAGRAWVGSLAILLVVTACDSRDATAAPVNVRIVGVRVRDIVRALRITPVHRDANGWIASGASEPVGDRSFGFLLRSTDGVSRHGEVAIHCYARPVSMPARTESRRCAPPVGGGACRPAATAVTGSTAGSSPATTARTGARRTTSAPSPSSASPQRTAALLPVPDPRAFAITRVVVVTP